MERRTLRFLLLMVMWKKISYFMACYEDSGKFNSKYGEEFDDFIKIGKTHLQEAVPIRLGQEFNAYASALSKDIKRLEASIDSLSDVNIGGTIIGTSINTNSKYLKKVIYYLIIIMLKIILEKVNVQL